MLGKAAVDVRIYGFPSEIKEFLHICRVVEQLGLHGAEKTIKIHVGGKLKFGFHTGKKKPFYEGEVELIDLIEDFNPDKVDSHTFNIGE